MKAPGQRVDHQHVVDGGPVRLRHAHAVRGGEVGGHRAHQVARHRARPARGALQRHLPRLGGRRSHGRRSSPPRPPNRGVDPAVVERGVPRWPVDQAVRRARPRSPTSALFLASPAARWSAARPSASTATPRRITSEPFSRPSAVRPPVERAPVAATVRPGVFGTMEDTQMTGGALRSASMDDFDLRMSEKASARCTRRSRRSSATRSTRSPRSSTDSARAAPIAGAGHRASSSCSTR